MSDWTPPTETIRTGYALSQSGDNLGSLTREFNRWLAAHDREVAARALREVAAELERLDDNPLIRSLVVNNRGADAMHEYALDTIRDYADRMARAER